MTIRQADNEHLGKKYSELDHASIGERIKSLRGKESQADFGTKFKRSYTDIGRLERGVVKPTPELLFNICTFYDVSIDWLLTGKGEMLAKESAPNSHELQPQAEDSADQYAFLPLYDMSASAGGGFCATDQEEVKTLLAFKKDWIHTELLANPEELFLVHVEGESMIPVLNPGDVILVKKQNGAPIKDGIHVVRLGDGILVKRVQRLPGDKIKISSENKAYEPYTLDLAEMDNFAVIGRVVWAGRRF